MSTEENDNDDNANVNILDVEEIDGTRRKGLDRNDLTRCKVDTFGIARLGYRRGLLQMLSCSMFVLYERYGRGCLLFFCRSSAWLSRILWIWLGRAFEEELRKGR